MLSRSTLIYSEEPNMKNMSTESLLQTYFIERNSSKNTQRIYRQVVKIFEEHTGKTLPEILEIAEAEEQKVKWTKSTLYYFLISFRKYLYDNLQPSTAQMKFTVIKTIIKYFDITVLPLKSFSTKKYHKVELTPEDIITQNELQTCVNVKNPLVKAIATFMSSSGCSLIDTFNLTIYDYVYSTREYHNLPCDDSKYIHEILDVLNSRKDIVPVFEKLRRQKTGVQYTTFCSPEAVISINNYLIYREKKEHESMGRYNKKHPDNPKFYPGLQLTDQLFKGSHGSIERMFRQVNEAVGLGKAGNYVKFAPHMMRRYHTSQLYAAGLSEYEINLLQGRKTHDVIHTSYLRVKVEALKEKYIKALPFLVVDDVYRIKTELEVVKDENKELKEANLKYKEVVDSIDERIESKIQEAMDSKDDVFDDLFS